MDHTENPVTVQDMVIEEPVAETAEVNADELFEALTSENEPEVAEQEEEPEKEPELTPEEAHKKSITDGIQSLFEDGWTGDELKEFSQDKQVREDIANGKTVRQAATAYMRRMRNASTVKPVTTKKGVPTVQASATSGAPNVNRVAEMTDKEFAEFSERAIRAAKDGKRVTIK